MPNRLVHGSRQYDKDKGHKTSSTPVDHNRKRRKSAFSSEGAPLDASVDIGVQVNFRFGAKSCTEFVGVAITNCRWYSCSSINDASTRPGTSTAIWPQLRTKEENSLGEKGLCKGAIIVILGTSMESFCRVVSLGIS